jgi:hypothetical protein
MKKITKRQIYADEAYVKGLFKLSRDLREDLFRGRYKVRKNDLKKVGRNDSIKEGSINTITQLTTLINSEQE